MGAGADTKRCAPAAVRRAAPLFLSARGPGDLLSIQATAIWRSWSRRRAVRRTLRTALRRPTRRQRAESAARVGRRGRPVADNYSKLARLRLGRSCACGSKPPPPQRSQLDFSFQNEPASKTAVARFVPRVRVRRELPAADTVLATRTAKKTRADVDRILFIRKEISHMMHTDGVRFHRPASPPRGRRGREIASGIHADSRNVSSSGGRGERPFYWVG